MKKSTIVVLMLVLAIASGFATEPLLTPYHTEAYNASVGYVDRPLYQPNHELNGSAAFVFGLENASGSFNADLGLAAFAELERYREGYSELDLSLGLVPSFDVDLNLGVFKGSLFGNVNLSGSKFYVVGEGSKVYKPLSFTFGTELAFKIPVGLDSLGFFNTYANGMFTNERYLGDMDDSSNALLAEAGFGYYLPVDTDGERKDFYDVIDGFNAGERTNVLKRSILAADKYDNLEDLIDNFKFVATTDADIVLEYAGGAKKPSMIVESAEANFLWNYHVATSTDVLTLRAEFDEAIMKTDDRSFDILKMSGDFGVYYKLEKEWGTNALDTFKMNLHSDVSCNYSCFDLSDTDYALATGGSIYFPRIIPVELLDNFSLALPTALAIDAYLTEKDDLDLSYSVEIVPFYMEVRNDVKFLNMYLNTVKLDAVYADAYCFKSKVHLGHNILAALTLGLDPVQGVYKDNASSINVRFNRDLVAKQNNVTIAFGAEF